LPKFHEFAENIKKVAGENPPTGPIMVHDVSPVINFGMRFGK
jgi:hypothetical protein